MLRAAPLPCTCAKFVKLRIFSKRTQWWTNTTTVRKLPIPPLPTTAYTTKTSKQKKTNEEKQAEKKELDRAALRGGALEAGWSAAEREEEGPGICTRSNF